MLRSMTGYGVAEGAVDTASVRVEIRTLNSRYFDFSSRIPSFLVPLENEIKAIVAEQIKRGKISLFVNFDGPHAFPVSSSIDHEKVSFFLRELKKVARKEGIKGEIELRDCLRFPDIFVTKQRKIPLKTVRKYLLPVIRQAVLNVCKMKKKEGKQLETMVG